MNYYELVHTLLEVWQNGSEIRHLGMFHVNLTVFSIFTWQHQKKQDEAYFKPLTAVRQTGQN